MAYCYKIGDCIDRELVGGKGSSLSIMKQMGLNVPPGVTLTTEAWRAWKSGKISIEQLYRRYVQPLLSKEVPLLARGQSVSVRSGAASSMPGMMETVLNLGAKDYPHKLAYLLSYIKASGLGLDEANELIDAELIRHGTFLVSNIPAANLIASLSQLAGAGAQGTWRQILLSAIQLVFESWDCPKAVDYRQRIGVPDDAGTACTIQLMVDGLKGFSGVLLTRGQNNLYPQIDWIRNAQGDSVVDGRLPTLGADALLDCYPEVYQELLKVGALVEAQYHDAMDIEFTYDTGQLYILQARAMKRTPLDAMALAANLYQDGVMLKQQVLNVPLVDDEYDVVTIEGRPLADGYPIMGRLLTGRAHVRQRAEIEPDHILIREITTTDNIRDMTVALATVTTTGGPTCHAALVARELGLTTIVGAGALDGELEHDEVITLTPDGKIYRGAVECQTVRQSHGLRQKLSELQDKLRAE